MGRYRKTIFSLIGIVVGVVLVHPYVMLVDQITGFRAASGSPWPTASGSLIVAFGPAMLPMTIAIAFFAGLCGLLLGLLFERNQRIVRFQYQARLHRDLTASLNQLLGVVAHYILNSSMMISGNARRLQKNVRPEDRQKLAAIIKQAEKNEAVLQLMQEAEFLQSIDPSDTTYQKLIDLNRQVEEHLKGENIPSGP